MPTNICIRTFDIRTFANVHLQTYFCIRTFAVRTLYPYVLLHTNFRVRTFAYVLLTYVLYTLRTFAYEHLHTNFCIRTFGIRTFNRTYFCIRTFAYEFLRTYFCRTYFIPYVLLHTNFRVRTFAYVLLTYVFYPLRIFAYVHLRTYFCPTYFSDTYFGPTIGAGTAAHTSRDRGGGGGTGRTTHRCQRSIDGKQESTSTAGPPLPSPASRLRLSRKRRPASRREPAPLSRAGRGVESRGYPPPRRPPSSHLHRSQSPYASANINTTNRRALNVRRQGDHPRRQRDSGGRSDPEVAQGDSAHGPGRLRAGQPRPEPGGSGRSACAAWCVSQP